MVTKNFLLRIFFYSILVVSSIHFINIKAMVESHFNNSFVFENFSARASDDFLLTEFIEIKEPELASSTVTLSDGMININGLQELKYSGSFDEDNSFNFNNQIAGSYGENIGYFRFTIKSPYPEAESVVYVVNNDKQYTYDLIDGSFDIDHPLAERKDGVNWTPINLGTQNLLIKFINSEDEELGIKSLVISNTEITQQQPTKIKTEVVSSAITPSAIMSISDGIINIDEIILNKDGSTNFRGLSFINELGVGEPDLRYLDFSFNLVNDEDLYPEINFLLNENLYDDSNKDFLIEYDKENKKITVYFAVVKINDADEFVPYYNEDSQEFSITTRFSDDKKIIKLEENIEVSFNLSGELDLSELSKFPVEQISANNEALESSNGYISFDSDIFLYQDGLLENTYLVDNGLNNKYSFSENYQELEELDNFCNYINFTLNFNSENSRLKTLKFVDEGQLIDYDFLNQNNALLYVINGENKLDFYYPIDCLSASKVGSSQKYNIINNVSWVVEYSDEKDYQYYFEFDFNLSGTCQKNEETIDLPVGSFSFEDRNIDKYSRKSSGLLNYGGEITSDIQKTYINQDVSKFSGSDKLRYFKIDLSSTGFEESTSSESNKIPSEKVSYSDEREIIKYIGEKSSNTSKTDSDIKRRATGEISYIKIEDTGDDYSSIITQNNSIYIPAFYYSSNKLTPYSIDQELVLNLIDNNCNIYMTKLRIVSKPAIKNKDISSTPVIDAKPIEPEYKEIYNPSTGELIRERINREENVPENSIISSKENTNVISAKLLTEAQMVDRSPKEEIKKLLLTSVNVEKADEELEKKVETRHQGLIVSASTPEVKVSLKNYLAYGTESTLRLGEGQRAATVINYTNIKGDIPQTESDIEDVLKIANNIVPLIRNPELEPKFLGNYYRLNNIIKENNITKIDENNLILELNQFLRFSYGVLPMERSIAREKWAIELFVKNYNKLPQTDGDWRIVNSWAYRNVLISQIENNLEWINSVSSENSEITAELLDKFFELAVK
jgi:hypothetical protein